MKINDIAKLANVSKSAVSLALNGKAGVSQETRKKILKIAEDHGYVTRSIVKPEGNLQSSSKLLRLVACTNGGMVTEQYRSLPFFMELINHIEKQASARGYSLLVSSINIKNFEEELSNLEQEQRSAGVLLLGTNLSREQISLISTTHSHLVVLDTCFETLDVNFIVMNNLYGAYHAGEYLIRLGHQNIGYVESNLRIYNFNMRKQGFQQAMNENGVEIQTNNFFSISPTSITSQESFKNIISNRLDQLPTALFCEADYMAISVIKSLTELGVKVPDDVSVVGFDNIFESQIITPELTTTHVKKDKMALLAVEKLIASINQENSDKIKILVDTELIIRNSTTNNN